MKRRLFLCSVVMTAILLTACGADESRDKQAAEYQMPEEDAESAEQRNVEEVETTAVYEYEPEVMRYSESSGDFSFRKDMEVTRTDYAAYYFDAAIDTAERNACIAATERMLFGIGATVPEIEIVVLSPESYDGILISGNRLYTPVQAWDSADYLAKVLLAGYGEWSNYGLAYGYADFLYRKAEVGEVGINHNNRERASDDGSEMPDDREETLNDIEPVSDDRENHSFVPASAPEVYDLTLLCFDERFVSAQDVEAAKNNACLFVEEYLSSHSEEDFQELLSASGTAEGLERVNGVLEEFYVENGVDCTLTKFRYQYGGVTLDYAAACEYARFYIDRDWQDALWEDNPMVSENFLHENYGEVRQFFECNVRQMEQYRELFDLDHYNNETTVIFPDDTSSLRVSYFHRESRKIYLTSVVSLMHEYIHSLMDGHDDPEHLWTYEGFARNYDCLYNDYAYDCWNYSYNNFTEIHGSHETGVFLDAYIEHIGRPIDIKNDHRDFGDFLAYAYEWKDPDLNYSSGASFVAYLVDCYGLQEVIEYIGADKKYNAEWDKSYEELVQEWLEYLGKKYAWYRAE